MTHASLGARRRRLVLERPVDEPDGFGGRLRRYVAGPILWGALEPAGAAAPRGGRAERAGLYRVRLRYRPGIDPAMRLADGARRFVIRAADDPDGTRRDLVCAALWRRCTKGWLRTARLHLRTIGGFSYAAT